MDNSLRNKHSSTLPLRRQFAWFAFGAWLFPTILFLIGAVIGAEGDVRWSGWFGFLLTALVGAPMMALLLGSAFVGWLKLRMWRVPEIHGYRAVPFAAGLVSLPALGSLAVMIFVNFGDLLSDGQDVVIPVLFFLVAFGLGEVSLRLQVLLTRRAG